MATTLVQGISKTIEERLSNGISEAMVALDPLWSRMRNSMESVSGSIGRDYKVIHTFSEGVSGAFKWTTPYGGAVDNTTLAHTTIPTEILTYPGIEDTVLPGYFQKTITLTKGVGNMFIPENYLVAQQLDASIGDVVADLIRGTARLVAESEIAPWYSTGVKSQICSIGAIEAGTAGVDTYITVAVKGGSVRNLQIGQHVDIYNSTGTTKRNTVPMVVDAARYLPASTDSGYGQVTLKTKDSSIVPATVVATDILTLWESAGQGPTGPYSWLINTGTAFGIDVDTYQQFQSLVVTNFGLPTETRISQMISRLVKAYGIDNVPNFHVTSQGVELAMLDTNFGLASFLKRDYGQLQELRMGFNAAGPRPIVFNGMAMEFHTTPFMPSDSDFSGTTEGGMWWGFKTKDGNLKRYVPPRIRGARSHEQFPMECQFLYGGNAHGPTGIWKPYHYNGRTSEWMEAPFNRYVEICPKVMTGMRLEGITELL